MDERRAGQAQHVGSDGLVTLSLGEGLLKDRSFELAECFGLRVAGLVQECTDDMKLPKSERRRLQIVDCPHKSDGAKLIKIADKISNVRVRIFHNPNDQQRVELADYVAWAEQVVAGCRGVNAALDAMFDETVANARSAL